MRAKSPEIQQWPCFRRERESRTGLGKGDPKEEKEKEERKDRKPRGLTNKQTNKQTKLLQHFLLQQHFLLHQYLLIHT